MDNDTLIEYIMWPIIIICNVAAYYYDYFMFQKIDPNETEELQEF